MQKTKTILLITALSLLIVAIVGIAYAQYVSAQPLGPNNYTTQTPYGYNGPCRILPPNTSNGTSTYPYTQGCYPYGTTQGGINPYLYGMGMHGRCW